MVSYFKQNQKKEMEVQDINFFIAESSGSLPGDDEANKGKILSEKR